jgi:hypothetical protein
MPHQGPYLRSPHNFAAGQMFCWAASEQLGVWGQTNLRGRKVVCRLCDYGIHGRLLPNLIIPISYAIIQSNSWSYEKSLFINGTGVLKLVYKMVRVASVSKIWLRRGALIFITETWYLHRMPCLGQRWSWSFYTDMQCQKLCHMKHYVINPSLQHRRITLNSINGEIRTLSRPHACNDEAFAI